MCVRQRSDTDDIGFFDLVHLFTRKLGGSHNISPWGRIDIVTAAALQSCAEDVRSNLPADATADQHLAVMQLEEIADAAVIALRLPCYTHPPRQPFRRHQTERENAK
jgi:hypothetical protein